MWDNLHDAQMRANKCVVRFNDKPVYIIAVDNGPNGPVAHFIYMLNGQRNSAPVNDERWNWKPVPTGYVNTGAGAIFVERRPVRKWKQGLSADNIKIQRMIRVSLQSLIKSRNMGRMIVRQYPTLAEAKEMVADPRIKSVAFHPEFPVVRRDVGPLYLSYRGEAVGWFEKDELVLGEDCQYLKEYAEEVLA